MKEKNMFQKFKNWLNNKKEEIEKPHFVKEINYAPNEPWRTDFIIGQRGSGSHAHVTASGAGLFYVREECGKEIVKDGKILTTKRERKNRKD